ncbi:hypothetical protein DVJ83_04505 [Deinococcus wulumuqiensis]|uniref:Uncharacterized protein n=1 Tax=Deinococcus wulumuqiensis TaxID=980427 RepID=A0A345IFS7_9DEIO|nr:hypothetical protein DVJ83_04505 [Deinococcus wulumuqiensis]
MLRSAHRNSLAPLCFAALQVGQKRCAFSVKCSKKPCRKVSDMAGRKTLKA